LVTEKEDFFLWKIHFYGANAWQWFVSIFLSGKKNQTDKIITQVVIRTLRIKLLSFNYLLSTYFLEMILIAFESFGKNPQILRLTEDLVESSPALEHTHLLFGSFFCQKVTIYSHTQINLPAFTTENETTVHIRSYSITFKLHFFVKYFYMYCKLSLILLSSVVSSNHWLVNFPRVFLTLPFVLKITISITFDFFA
jgi:hypothetical protein